MKPSNRTTMIYLLKMSHFLTLIVWVLFLSACDTRLTEADIDYSDSQWVTIEGKKYSTFMPEAQVRYYVRNKEVKGCGGSSLQQIYNNQALPNRKSLTFMAEESDKGRFYRIRVPRQFNWGKCHYATGGAEIYMEEKSDDPRLLDTSEYAKNMTRRRSIVAGGRLSTLLFRQTEKSANTFVDEKTLNIYCYRFRRWAFDKNFGLVTRLYCDTPVGTKKNIMFLYYSNAFLANNPITLNLKVSNQTYCRPLSETDCNEEGEKELPRIPEKFRDTIKSDWFNPFNEEDNSNAR
ncbi:hypothetical protein QJU23_10365 [Pasteurella atlantica]|uniref:Uncharacterized protein n=2 Tax=Pasteurellaceae TaxID=712 RepID=A0ACC6HPJ8_9PAST|nr:hypothetical protein [Pasteurella atlantica]MDP8052814.1 hypothetical protein [Pasteurella atlantica]MDP8149495.1 hypothetical protein [Pasteurella atlantica]